jgi:hypothetical protein
LREVLVNLIFRRGKRKIPNVELLHLPAPSARNPVASRGARQSTSVVHGQSGESSQHGRETGASAVRGIVSKINWICNGNVFALGGNLLSAGPSVGAYSAESPASGIVVPSARYWWLSVTGSRVTPRFSDCFLPL